MQQYWEVKSAHADKVVLFRMGDFFEMFHADAEVAAPLLGIALTARNKKAADETKMCGVPHHSVGSSINKLLASGHKVAICDQVEDPKLAKGLVKRAVTRILSPGVVYDPDTLDRMRAHYLASFDDRSVSFLDITTGEAFYFLTPDHDKRRRLLASLHPAEMVVSADQENRDPLLKDLEFEVLVTVHSAGLGSWSKKSTTADIESAQRLLSYACYMQGEGVLETLAPFEERKLSARMEIPVSVLRHLEVFETYRGEPKGTLFSAINRCKTSAGSRLLRQWLQFPLLELASIQARAGRVEHWLGQKQGQSQGQRQGQRQADLKQVRTALGGMGDVQRRLGRLTHPNVHPRDLLTLCDSLRAGLEVSSLVGDVMWDRDVLDLVQELCREIEQTLEDEPPAQLKNGGIVRRGVDTRLDELIEISTDSHRLVLELEAREREATGIPSLKVRYNQVFGYYLEVTNTHKEKVPKDRYLRKQTLANAERFVTDELADLERKVLSAQSRRLELESEIFSQLVARVLGESQKLSKIACLWSEVDVITSLAWLALEQNYVRPKLLAGGSIRLIGSRHPVVEQSLKLPFVANDIQMALGSGLLLTGPNMAGKSTLMRQVAVTAIMAQMGSFVPASDATLPLFDRIYTRIGASDFLTEGLSTFMVEMKETAEMLAGASQNSLVILDEVGRGTSTYDGMSLARAILEYLLEDRQTTTLFATHYHELTELALEHPRLHNAHMSLHEKREDITFLYQLKKGPANKSYGIHVARLAGLPPSVTARAAAILEQWERAEAIQQPQSQSQGCEQGESEINTVIESEVEGEIKTLDVSKLTPLAALNLIAKWQQELS